LSKGGGAAADLHRHHLKTVPGRRPDRKRHVIVMPAPLRHFRLGDLPAYTVNIANSSRLIEGLS
jgi:hypothetical protein